MNSETKNDYFGLETIFQAFQTSIKKKSDVVVLLVHWFLTFKKNLQFTGIGDPLEPPPENHLLNENWNESAVNYLMHYSIRDLEFTLTACISEDSLIMNLVDIGKHLISQMVLEVKYAVKNFENSEDIISCIENLDTIIQRVDVELVNPVYKIPLKDRTTQIQKEEEELLLKVLSLKRKTKKIWSGPSVCKNILHILNADCAVPHPNKEEKHIFKKCKDNSIPMGGRAFSQKKKSQKLSKREENINHFHFLMYS